MAESIRTVPPGFDFYERQRAKISARDWRIHGLLFLLTIVTTSVAGLMQGAIGSPSTTTFPLKVQSLDPKAEPEPRPIVRMLDRQEARFPLVPAKEERAKDGLALRIDLLEARSARVTLERPDSDFRVSYFFAMEGCWRLTAIEDESL